MTTCHRLRIAPLIALFALLVSACGQKGPLTLPSGAQTSKTTQAPSQQPAGGMSPTQNRKDQP